MPPVELKDSGWYLVVYESCGTTYRAPAMYKENVGCFYSYEFSGIPVRHLEVVREIETEA